MRALLTVLVVSGALSIAASGCGRRTLVVVGEDAEGDDGGGEDAAEGEGEGAPPAEGEGEGEGAPPAEGEGEGEGEPPAEGEGEPEPLPYCAGVDACREEKEAAGPDSTSPITWCSHVRGPLQTHCVGCHSGGNPASGWSAETYAAAFEDGDRDGDELTIVPCCRENELLRAASGSDGFFAHRDKIVGQQYKDLEDWITVHGAPKGEGCD